VSWPTRAEVGPIALQWHSETAVDTDAIMILDCAYVTQEHLWHQITMTTEAIVIFYFSDIGRCVDEYQVAQFSSCKYKLTKYH
jgi:hypothetical protein